MNTVNTTLDENRLHEITVMPLNARQIQTVNGYVVFVTATVLNVLLVIVLRSERNLKLKAYSNVLTLNCACDLFYTVISTLTDMQYEVDNRGIFFVCGGVFNWLPTHWQFFGAWLDLSGMYLSMFVIPIIFYTRYALVIRKKELDAWRLVTLSMIPIAASLTLSSFVAAGLVTTQRQRRFSCAELFSNPIWTYGGASIDKCLYLDAENVYSRWYTFIYILFAVINYALLIYFNMRIFAHMSRLSDGVLVSKFQRQLSLLMAMQLILPLMCTSFPTLMVILTLFARVRLVGANIFAALFVQWIPLINPLLALIFVANYRRRVARLVVRVATCGRAARIRTATTENPLTKKFGTHQASDEPSGALKWGA